MAEQSFLFGSPTRYETRALLRPQQEQAQMTAMQRGLANLQNPSAGFDPIRKRATNDFFQQVVPGLLERFNAMGDNAMSSPSLQANLSSAGAGLQERLAALESEYGLQREGLGLNQLGLGLRPMDETIMLSGDPGFLGGASQGIGEGIGKLLPILAQLVGAYFGVSI